MLQKYNLYLNNGADSFIIKDMKEFEKYVREELKDFIGKEKLNLKPNSIEELEKTIEVINEKNKNQISFFLISKEDDEESQF